MGRFPAKSTPNKSRPPRGPGKRPRLLSRLLKSVNHCHANARSSPNKPVILPFNAERNAISPDCPYNQT